MSDASALSEILAHIESGRFFSACDLAREKLTTDPSNVALQQAYARTLILTGASAEARAVLEPIRPTLSAQNLREAEETAGLLGRTYKDLWRQSGESTWALKSQQAYSLGYELTGGLWPGINAATMARLASEERRAKDLARQLIEKCHAMKNEAAPLYWTFATQGEAHLLLGDTQRARDAYAEARRHAEGVASRLVSSRRQLLLLREHGIEVPDEILSILLPPAVIQFAGHMVDRPGRTEPRFPPGLEGAVRSAMDAYLDRFDAAIGYSSAACGGDILFAEAMLRRNWELNIMLPFALDDFIATSVDYAGQAWVNRFHRVLEGATRVFFLTEESFLGDVILFEFAGLLFQGFARLRANSLGQDAHLLTLWDRKDSQAIGGTAQIVKSWKRSPNVFVIPMDQLLDEQREQDLGIQAKERPFLRQVETSSPMPRSIKTLLFADIVNYTRLRENDTPRFVMQFLARIASDLEVLEVRPQFLNTWGDALFVVMDSALGLAHYGEALRRSVCETDWNAIGLPTDMNIRVALHAGPVFEGQDPLSGRLNYYGAHVNRVARIEATTRAGQIYVSEQFAALLEVEQKTAPEYACDYVGVIELAKKFGRQAVYRLRRRSERPQALKL